QIEQGSFFETGVRRIREEKPGPGRGRFPAAQRANRRAEESERVAPGEIQNPRLSHDHRFGRGRQEGRRIRLYARRTKSLHCCFGQGEETSLSETTRFRITSSKKIPKSEMRSDDPSTGRKRFEQFCAAIGWERHAFDNSASGRLLLAGKPSELRGSLRLVSD